MLSPVSVLHSILWVINILLYGNTTFYLSIHQLVGILVCFHFLAIMSNAAVNICVQIFMWTMPSLFTMPIFWLLDVNCWLIGKVPDAEKDWRKKEKRVSEDEMAGWHHWCNGHELWQTLGDGEGLVAWCAAVHGVTELDTTGRLNENEQRVFNALGSVYF